jgi:four helix bundle protein
MSNTTYMKHSILQERSYAFALQVINISRNISDKKREYILTKQLIRSGTSIGANIQEASEAQSRKDFISKLSISLKESKETVYWLKLIRDSNLESRIIMEGAISECNQIMYLLIASIKTAKKKLLA